jgi:GAF domain-containing protein
VAGYRLYFLGPTGGIQARQDFPAPSDADALTIADFLWQACADCYPGFELWSLARRIVSAREPVVVAAPSRIEDLPQDLQERILELQESLERSAWRVSGSGRLRDATEALRRTLRGKPRSVGPGDVVAYIRAATGAEMLSFQLVEDTRLRLRGTHGFGQWFSDYFDIVEGADCCCGVALKEAKQIVVPEVAQSSIFAGQPSLQVLRASGVVSCVSTPLVGAGGGKVHGMFSIHRGQVWKPASREIDQLDQLAHQIAAALSDRMSPEAAMIRQPG